MKNSTLITAIKSRLSFHKRTLKKFVNNKSINTASAENNHRRDGFLTNYETIDYSSTLIPATGTLEIFLDARHPESISRISIPVQSAFLVTCTKEGIENYKVAWSCSMS